MTNQHSTPINLQKFSTTDLINFNIEISKQALQVIAAWENYNNNTKNTNAKDKFSIYIGPHLRHNLEHYEALTAVLDNPQQAVDYDGRSRDRSVEQEPMLMRARYQKLADTLASWNGDTVLQSINVRLLGGLNGDSEFITTSTVARELLFVASHAIHHYALVQVWCLQRGIKLVNNFGKAPATVAYEQNIN